MQGKSGSQRSLSTIQSAYITMLVLGRAIGSAHNTLSVNDELGTCKLILEWSLNDTVTACNVFQVGASLL